MQRHAIPLEIALDALQIGAVIRVVMEDRGRAIAAGEDMIKPAGDVEAWLAGYNGVGISPYSCPTPILYWNEPFSQNCALTLIFSFAARSANG
jgi:hypothetical protein